jgi:hypothetical protein
LKQGRQKRKNSKEKTPEQFLEFFV